jgi:S-methylmethionine-dependent homocysteine/selenocysteine methylase
LEKRAKELTQLAVSLAKQARKNSGQKNVWIAGSIAPLEDCYEPSLTPDPETAYREHSEFVSWLADAGVDLFLIETMNSIEEANAAARAVQRIGIPMFVSWTCASDGNILNGQSVKDAIGTLEQYKPAAFLVNCTPAKTIGSTLRKMREATKTPIGAYGNIGKPEPVNGWEFTRELDAAAYARFAQDWNRDGATIIGGCCGTTPDHISLLKDRFGD